jgi:hypothetical protein
MRLIHLLCAAATTLAVAASAYPALTGPTGLVALPDGRVAHRPAVAGDMLDNANVRGAHLRMLAGSDRAEVAGVYVRDDLRQVGLAAKLRFGPRLGPLSTALGAQWLDAPGMETRAVYAAATYAPRGPVDLTLGISHTRVGTSGGAMSGWRPSIGVRVKLPDGRLLTAECQGGAHGLTEGRPLTSLMLTRRDRRGLQYTLGVTNASGLVGNRHHSLFTGVAYERAR